MATALPLKKGFRHVPLAAIEKITPIFGVHGRGVCTENSVRIDLVTESPNVSDDGRVVILLPGAVRLAVQVEEPN